MELLLIFFVAFMVFGPNKLPMLAEHLAKLLHFIKGCRQDFLIFWDNQAKAFMLKENEEKANKADQIYKQRKPDTSANSPTIDQ